MNSHGSSFRSLFPKIFSLIIAAAIVLSCGGKPARQLDTISVSPASARPPSGGTTVQFTATGVYNLAPSPVTPLQATWAAAVPNLGPTTAVAIDASGLAQCTPAASGVYWIGAWDLRDPNSKVSCSVVGLFGESPCNSALGTAQLTCP
jgi:hypothetical protein